MTGYTVIETEPEWDLWSQRRAIALTYYDDTHCKNCGNDLHLSSDPVVAALVDVNDELVCWTCAATAQHRRALEEAHKNDPTFFDGRSVTASLLPERVKEAERRG